jgi:nickel/cobalt transporter (NiCoT) family protein
VLVALLIGSIEVLGLLADKLAFEGGMWNSVRVLKDSLGTFGVFVIGLFVLCWIVSAVIYRWNRYDELAPEIARPHH